MKYNKYDAEPLSAAEIDEFSCFHVPGGKQFKIGKFFYLYYEKYFFCFRFFDGYGLSGKSLKKKWPLALFYY